MDPEMVARTIQLIIAPAVMITSCCIFGAGLLGHYSAIGERLRLTVGERVDLLRETESGTPSSLIAKERLKDIDFQTPNLLRRHLFVRTALAGVLIAMIFYILDMFVIAFSVISSLPSLYNAVLVIFMIGVASQLIGVVYAVFDLLCSIRFPRLKLAMCCFWIDRMSSIRKYERNRS
ncbi:MAG: hypothetical protein A2W33_07665 [Chloroflexi bacterium RBG_16_52_11]|nr:MAG: hypothetical protein A2W33_07665 [Chloroflexi bacterium RBG_16_52_11]